ncbi:gp38 [Staphylococcus phage vB_SauS-phiIPLA88]|uniref:Gp38 n=1 Tax=Staphylococcus phage vB_SauS-phiIPLA88 TaxID=2681608 RepID=B7T0C8_9CAUD|nr:hypothetical protein SauSIPLA88_gp38 [Staphylococcus phage vB_SauS-phiIPLA88]ACJ64566.1 gp38 [Staphylococcus phage vB_SauS-phiIPLA88]
MRKNLLKKLKKVFIKTLETSMMTNKMMIQKILLIKRKDCNCLTKTLKNIGKNADAKQSRMS